MLHPLYLWGPIGALAGWLGAAAFHRASHRTSASDDSASVPAGNPSSGPVDDCGDDLSAYLRQQTKMTVSLLCAAFVAFLLLYFLGAQPAALAPAFLLGGLCSAGGSFLGLKLAATARRRFLAGPSDDPNSAWDRARQASAAIGLACHSSALVLLCLGVAATFGLGNHLPMEEASLQLGSFALGAGWQAFWSQLQTQPLARAAGLNAAGTAETATASPALARQTALVAGHGAELHGSHVAAVLAATTLAAAAAVSIAPTDTAASARIAMLPVAVAGVGLLGSTLGFALAHRRHASERASFWGGYGPALMTSAVLTAAGSAPLFAAAFKEFLLPNPGGWVGLWGCLGLGLATSLLTIALADRSGATSGNPTASEPPPEQRLDTWASRLCSDWPPAALLAVALLGTLKLSGGLEHPSLGLFGLALTAVGALSPLATVMSRAALPAITGNANQSGKNDLSAPQRCSSDQLALSAAALTTLSLLAVYTLELKSGLVRATSAGPNFVAWGGLTVDEIQARAATHRELMGWYDATLLNPLMLVAGLLGAIIASQVWTGALRAAIGVSHPREPGADETPSGGAQVATCNGAPTAAAAERVQAASWKAVLLTLLAPLLVSGLLGPAAAIGLVLGALAVAVTLGLSGSRGALAPTGPESPSLKLTALLGALSKLLALLIALSAGAAVTFSPAVLGSLGVF